STPTRSAASTGTAPVPRPPRHRPPARPRLRRQRRSGVTSRLWLRRLRRASLSHGREAQSPLPRRTSMKTIWKTDALMAALWLTLPLSAAAARIDEPDEAGIEAIDGVAAGLGVNVPLVGRLTGGGNTLYISTVDVTNNSTTDTQVDFYLDGQDLASG